MKKVFRIFSASFLAGVVLLAGCSKKKDDAKPAPSVTIDSIPALGSYKNQAFYTVGSPITLTYTITSSENLAKVYTGETAVPATAAVKASVTKTSDFTTATSYVSTYTSSFPAGATSLSIKIEGFDTKNLSNSKTFVARNIISDQLIGAEGYNNTTSFYSTVNNKVYNKDEFSANKDKIDITYGYYTAPGTSAPAPLLLSSDLRGQISGVSTGVGGVKTYFKESTWSQTSFTTVTAAELSTIAASSVQFAPITQGKVYEFVSPTIKTKGLINVKTYNPTGNTNASTVTFDVKYITF